MQYWEPCMRSERNSARMFESIYGMMGIDVLTHLARLFVTLLRPASSRRRPVMECHNQKQLCDELIELLGKQLDILEIETFCGLTATDRRKYEERGNRIHQLYDELFIPRIAASCLYPFCRIVHLLSPTEDELCWPIVWGRPQSTNSRTGLVFLAESRRLFLT
jgi:hypothetical protein